MDVEKFKNFMKKFESGDFFIDNSPEMGILYDLHVVDDKLATPENELRIEDVGSIDIVLENIGDFLC